MTWGKGSSLAPTSGYSYSGICIFYSFPQMLCLVNQLGSAGYTSSFHSVESSLSAAVQYPIVCRQLRQQGFMVRAALPCTTGVYVGRLFTSCCLCFFFW